MLVSIIIPVLNEAEHIALHLEQLLKQIKTSSASAEVEVIVVDGGSVDATQAQLQAFKPAVQCLHSQRGRALQMNKGAYAARGKILLFLHADTYLPEHFLQPVLSAIDSGAHWGRFDVRLGSKKTWARIVSAMINWRSRLSGIATGDQAIFVRRDAFLSVSGFPEQPLMEDVEICKRLKKYGAPACLKQNVITSSRRWEKHGVIKTIVLMWQLRFYYFIGVRPEHLYQKYYKKTDD